MTVGSWCYQVAERLTGAPLDRDAYVTAKANAQRIMARKPGREIAPPAEWFIDDANTEMPVAA